MFTNFEFYRISDSLESDAIKTAEMCTYWREKIQVHINSGEQEKAQKVMNSLNRSERKLEEIKSLILKTEAFRRWSEAEKVLFPERFTV